MSGATEMAEIRSAEDQAVEMLATDAEGRTVDAPALIRAIREEMGWSAYEINEFLTTDHGLLAQESVR